jgi:hypothetical protein
MMSSEDRFTLFGIMLKRWLIGDIPYLSRARLPA